MLKVIFSSFFQKRKKLFFFVFSKKKKKKKIDISRKKNKKNAFHHFFCFSFHSRHSFSSSPLSSQRRELHLLHSLQTLRCDGLRSRQLRQWCMGAIRHQEVGPLRQRRAPHQPRLGAAWPCALRPLRHAADDDFSSHFFHHLPSLLLLRDNVTCVGMRIRVSEVNFNNNNKYQHELLHHHL